jgi:hypothetical protein
MIVVRVISWPAGLLHRTEALLGSGVFGIGIRVVLADQLTMRSQNCIYGSLFGQPEQLIHPC